MKKFFLLYVAILASSVFSFGQQVKRFSMIPDEFFNQIDSFFEATGAKNDKSTEILKELKTLWEGDAFTEDYRKTIIKTCNLLLAKRGKATPHYLDYFRAMITLYNSPEGKANLETWEKSFSHIVDEKNIGAADMYNLTVIGVVTEQILNKTASSKWVFSSPKYTFIFDNEPGIELKEIDLKCLAKGDSAIISQTQGVYYPLSSTWVGKDGKINWTRAGMDENTVYATLTNYKIDMRTSGYKADSVTFVNKTYYDKPMLGSLEEKIVADVTTENASYPAFDSYDKLYFMKDIYQGIDYKGGFSMKGSKFLGSGSRLQDAMLFFYRNDTLFLTCRSKIYVFKKDFVIGKNTSITFNHRSDSIYHPGLFFKYVVKTREVSLIRDRDPQSMSASPYFNTYHKIDMNIEQLTWPLDKEEMKMGAMRGSIVNKASFESGNYFRESRYNEIQLADEIHPLVALRKYSDIVKSETFYADEFAGYMKKDITQIRQMCLGLLYKGLIDFSMSSEQIRLKQRLFDYLKARVGKIDYDVIKFDSEHDMIGLENGSLSITNMDLKLYGVSKIQVSDSQNVIIYPRGRQLTMRKNRDFTFDGVIDAGYFTLYGQNFDFSYEKFKIELKNIDSLKIKVESFNTDQYGQKTLLDIQNVIENITGDLLIDDPNNKSSIKHFPQYPVFNSKQPSFVYYDNQSIQEGAYDREKFYFAVDPYTVDSLNSFTTKGLNFDGEFFSADILPSFREKLTVQKDYSLGFTRQTPPGGYPIYKGKGTFTDTINLSNQGLVGNGTVTYLNTTSKSNGFIFLPDSMNGECNSYEIKSQGKDAGAEFPQVNAQHVSVHWEPQKDVYEAKQLDSAFVMYNGMAKLSGSTVFTPGGLHGKGEFVFGNARLTSKGYTFLENEAMADTAKFDLMLSGQANEFAFKTQNVNAYLNFNEKKGTFKSNDKMTVVQFPQNKYVCYLDKFSWDMVTEKMELGASITNAQETASGVMAGSRFVSVHPRQDTLNFIAPISQYDLKKFIISSKKVQYINVADAVIYPGQEGQVIIEPNAVMQTLKEAKITANNTTKYHTIYDATVDIQGRLKYTGSGKYDYIDENKKKQTLLFNLIGVDSSRQTYANAVVGQKDTFFLSPDYQYRGGIKMNAPNQYLTFDGVTSISTECTTLPTRWFKFRSEINPNNILIPVDTAVVDIETKMLYSGIFKSIDSIQLYAAFLSQKTSNNDKPILSVSGFLHYDKTQKRYEIGSKEKLLDKSEAGNYLWLHRQYCQMYGEGKLDLSVDLGQVKLSTYGNVLYNIPSNKTNFETVAFVDFYFPTSLLNTMGDTINSNTSLGKPSMSRHTYNIALVNVVGKKKTREIATEIQIFGNTKRVHESFAHTITFSQLDLAWNSKTKSYKSIGKIGIGSILNKQVNKFVNGFVEIACKKTGDAISIYLEVSDGVWYYFNYTKELMLTVSSDAGYNSYIEGLKASKRVSKGGKKEAKYEFQLTTDAKKSTFIQNFLEDKVEEDVISTDSLLTHADTTYFANVDSALLDSLSRNMEVEDAEIETSTTAETAIEPKDNEQPVKLAPEQPKSPEPDDAQLQYAAQKEKEKQEAEEAKRAEKEALEAAAEAEKAEKEYERNEQKKKEAEELKRKEEEKRLKQEEQARKDKELKTQSLRDENEEEVDLGSDEDEAPAPSPAQQEQEPNKEQSVNEKPTTNTGEADDNNTNNEPQQVLDEEQMKEKMLKDEKARIAAEKEARKNEEAEAKRQAKEEKAREKQAKADAKRQAAEEESMREAMEDANK